MQEKLDILKLKNKSGKFIEPSIKAVSEAANTPIPTDTRASITNSSAKNGYPISGFTWIIAFQDQDFNSRSIAQAKETKKLLEWMIKDGQEFVSPLHYAPLTEVVKSKAQKIIDSMTFSGTVL